jgi:hypothetical protein
MVRGPRPLFTLMNVYVPCASSRYKVYLIACLKARTVQVTPRSNEISCIIGVWKIGMVVNNNHAYVFDFK